MRATAILTAILLALGLTACGGGGSGSTSTGSQTTTAQSGEEVGAQGGQPSDRAGGPGESGGRPSEKSGGSASGQGGEAAKRRPVNAAPLKVSGEGSAQFKVKGGDNSVQEYGSEEGESELREAAETVHAFYVARLAGEWAKACSYMTAKQTQSLEQLGSQSPQLKGKGCPAALAAFTKPVSPSLQRQLTTVDAASLRSEGEQSFLIYTGPPGKTVYAMPMTSEGGQWKVGALSAAALPGAK